MSDKRKLPGWLFVIVAILLVAWVVTLVCVVPAFAVPVEPGSEMPSVNWEYMYYDSQTQYTDLNDSYKSLNSAYNTLSNNYSSLNAEHNTLKGQYDTLEDQYDALQEQFDDLKDKYDTLQEDFNLLKTQGYSTSDVNDGVDQPNESMSGIVASVFGTYSPKTQTVSLTLDNGMVVTSQEIIPGVAGMDWHWIAGVFLFAVVLWSFFRFMGVIFKHG